MARERHEYSAGPRCLNCRGTGHIAKNRPKKFGSSYTDAGQISIAIVAISNASSMVSRNDDKSTKWMLESCCSRHMSNNPAYVSDLLECEGVVQVRNNEMIP